MKTKIVEKVNIPEGISCEYSDKMLKCKKGSLQVEKKLDIPGVKVEIQAKDIVFSCEKGNKNDFKIIKSYVQHVGNTFKGLNEKFSYKLEACNVHFPISMKVVADKLEIKNFLGEKVPRFANILPGVNVEIKGTSIVLQSHDKESAGQTAANIEKATKVRKRDRRIFQDGIYITEKCGEAI